MGVDVDVDGNWECKYLREREIVFSRKMFHYLLHNR